MKAARQSWYSWLSVLHSLQLWQVALKRVSGRFGTGVLSYFVFIKTLLLFNVFLFLVTGAFLVLPQVLFPPVLTAGRPSFYGLELLTGAVSCTLWDLTKKTKKKHKTNLLNAKILSLGKTHKATNGLLFPPLFQGYFTDTVMYYGYYANYTLQKSCRDGVGDHNISLSNHTTLECTSKRHSYNMPLAYFFTIGVAFFITCIILVYRYGNTHLWTHTAHSSIIVWSVTACVHVTTTACQSRLVGASESTSLTASWPWRSSAPGTSRSLGRRPSK